MTPGHAPTARPEATTGAGTVAPVRRMRWHLTPQPPLPAHPSPRIKGARIAVLSGTPHLAAHVTARLRAHGAHVIEDPGQGGDWNIDGHPPDGLIDLTLAEPFDPDRTGAHEAALERTLAALRACYTPWAQVTATDRLFYLAVTYLGGHMGYDPAGGAGEVQPLGGIWAGLAKTLHREIPNCNTRILDTSLDELDQLPERICRELYRWGLFETGHHRGQRLTLHAHTEDAGPPALTLSADDLVLISGGGRGIGWRLATALARQHGCRIIVTGRTPLPDPTTQPWLTAPEPQFAAYERQLWAQHATGRPLTHIRAALTTARRARELLTHLTTARHDGLHITYAPCDVTDPTALDTLLAGLDRPPTAVIHNAGIDTPARLPKKTTTQFLHTVATKTDSFLNLFQRTRSLPLKFFCTVGSLTGRLGGMVGQLDYAAANEGLARLALWADHTAPFPVMTLCWPTWDRIGMVANFRATLRYMTALDADEGTNLWLTELTAATHGEVTYLGPFGKALGPLQARGYPPSQDLPGHHALIPALFHLGDPLDHHPHHSLTARLTLTRRQTPLLGDFEVTGTEALPISLLLENALWTAHWLPPEDLADLVPDRLEDIHVHPHALRLDAGAAPLERTAHAGYAHGNWQVEVVYRTRTAPPREAARLRIVHRPRATPPTPADPPTTARGAARAPHGALRPAAGAGHHLNWPGRVLPLAQWHQRPDGTSHTRLTETPANDIWMLPRWPEHTLPLTAVENALARTHTPDHNGPPHLTVHRISLPQPPGTTRLSGTRLLIEGDPHHGNWLVTDETTGAPVLHIHHVSYQGETP